MLRFGLVTYPSWQRPGRISRVTLFQHTAAEVYAAEAACFISSWTGKHHFHEHFAAGPDPLILLAYLAGQTTSLRLGTAAVLPALHNPIRLAEEIAFADVFSDGRIDVGVGGGYSVEDF